MLCDFCDNDATVHYTISHSSILTLDCCSKHMLTKQPQRDIYGLWWWLDNENNVCWRDEQVEEEDENDTRGS